MSKHIGSNFDDFLEEEGIVINITIDDLINGNLRDMEITAQFGVYRQAVKGLAEQLKAKEQECEKLKKEVKKQKEIAKEYEQRWLNSYGV